MSSPKLTNGLLIRCVALLTFIAIQVTTLSTHRQVNQLSQDIDKRTRLLATTDALNPQILMLQQHAVSEMRCPQYAPTNQNLSIGNANC